MRYSSDGPGVISHLGKVWFHIEHCTYLSADRATGRFDQGRIVVTAANGDELYLTESGTFSLVVDSPDAVHTVATVNFIVAGGTGRFTNATGSGHVSAVSTDLNTLPSSVTGTFYDSTIVYHASDRS